jgi:hypothetical protein
MAQPRTPRYAVSAAVCLALAAALVLPGSAAAAGPQLALQITHSPDTFHRGESFTTQDGGDYYTIAATNTGDAPTSGPYTITNPVPVGLTLAPISNGGSSTPLSACTTQYGGGATIVCTKEGLDPGSTASIKVPVNVAKNAPDILANTVTVSGGGAPDASASDPIPVADRPFAITSFTAATTDPDELDYTLAGGHPFANHVHFAWPLNDKGRTGEFLRDAAVDLPLGFFGNPASASYCSSAIILEQVEQSVSGQLLCPPGSMVGYAAVGTGVVSPLYNVRPDRGYPAQFAFPAANTTTVVSLYATARPRTESYGLTIGSTNANQLSSVRAVDTVFCENGAELSGPLAAPLIECKSSPAPGQASFLTNPVDCSEANPIWKVAIDSWEHSGARDPITGRPELSDPNWKTATTPALPVTECGDPALADQFNATTIATKPLQPGGGATQADQPTGLDVDLDFPQSNDPTDSNTTLDPETPQAPEPKDITVKLPAGLSISPSSADGLGACSDQASNPAGDQVHYDNVKPVSCPDSSKIGSATATSPLLALRDPTDNHIIGPEPIPGDVYLLAPHPGDLPVGGGSQEGKFRLLIQLENPGAGVNFKLPGIATADPNTGQLTATFTQNPQLPASHITVSLKEGPRAPLATPVTCGRFDSTSDLVPWSTPETPDAHPTASFEVKSGPNGTACPASAAARPFAPTLSAGPESSKAGAHSPFVLHIARNDGEGELSSLEATLPKGLGAIFAGVPYCSEAALAAAAGRSGKAEQANPTCPASRIGTVTVGAGPGADPFYATGSAYLAGPYKGAPLSVAVITPAVAGPFDLGTVVSRNALYVNPETAQGHVVSDPLPTIIDGVPLRLRSIDVNLDRSNFTLNPTNCEPLSVQATIHSSDGATASPTDAFQVGGCKDLGFKPKLKLSLKGKISRRSHPSLRASLTARPGDANIARAQIKLPKSAFLDNAHIGEICTRVQFAAKACPAGSIYGYASATTPLLGYPLTGNVYLRSSSHQLPDLVVGFTGPSSQPIEIELAGKTDSVKGALRNTFEAIPDVPVSKFNLTLFGGKKGLIIMSSGFCKDPRASFKFTGQNGMEFDTTPRVGGKCPKSMRHNGAEH